MSSRISKNKKQNKKKNKKQNKIRKIQNILGKIKL